MALTWYWNDKCGEIKCIGYNDEPYTESLYQGNAYLIMLYLYKNAYGDDCYNLTGFFTDKEHAKRFLGIDPKYTETYNENVVADTWKEIILYKDKLGVKKTAEIVSMLAKAFDELKITITIEPKEGE